MTYPFYSQEYCPTCSNVLLVDENAMGDIALCKNGTLPRSEYVYWCINCEDQVTFTATIPVQGVSVAWNENLGNAAELHLRLEYWPSWADFRYSQHILHYNDRVEALFYVAELEGAVSFYWPAHRNGQEIPGVGFGGRAFHIIMKSGEHHDLLGPGAGSPSVINAVVKNLEIVPCAWTLSPEEFRRGDKGSFSTGYVTKAIAEEAIRKSHNGFKLVKVNLTGGSLPAYIWAIARPDYPYNERTTTWSGLALLLTQLKSK